MTERIDHAKAADELMRKLASAPATDDEHDVEWGFREAQVHATLALVEQQRIANLIEIARFDHHVEGDARLYTNLEASAKWRNEAAEALGLS